MEGTPEPAEEPEIAEEQQADPCASLEIAEVGGSASNGYALWVWKGSPVADGGCWVDFKLSYSDDYGATFTEAAVVRRGMGAKASEYRYSIATVPAMMEGTIDNVGAVPREVSADAGYYLAKAVGELYALGVDPFVAAEQTRHGRVVPPAPRGRIPNHLSPRDRMRRKLQTRRGRQRYALRMQTVEPVFGQIKQGRGFRQFLLRGLEKVNGEWLLICTGHNLLKLFRFGVNLHGKARVDGPAQRIRNFAEVVEHGAIRKAIWGPAGATGKISCRDPLSLTRKHR